MILICHKSTYYNKEVKAKKKVIEYLGNSVAVKVFLSSKLYALVHRLEKNYAITYLTSAEFTGYFSDDCTSDGCGDHQFFSDSVAEVFANRI